MKHIAYIATEYPHKSTKPTGGIGSFIKTMSESLTKKGYKVTVFLCLSKLDEIWLDNKVRIVAIKSVKPSLLSPFKDRLKIAKRIKTHIKNDKIDLVEAADWEGLHAFCNFKIPLITRIHGSVTYFNHLQNLPKSKLLSFLEKKALQKSTKIIAVSNYAAKTTALLFKLKLEKIEVIYSGIALEKDISISENNTTEPPMLLHFGTLVRKKGVLDLPIIFNEIQKKYPKYKLLILGKDTIDSSKKVSTWSLMEKKFTKQALNNVKYLGAVDQNLLKKYILKATACIFTSYAETFGLVTIEAMALKKPVIIYDFPWVREIIDHKKDGILIDSTDILNRNKVISSTLGDLKKMEFIGLNARKKIEEKFNLHHQIKKNITLYTKVSNCE